jgi:2-polyprenyl-6-hydroxyphenyl methylase/3-demethylubiquinone-9 3-methyltransferase
MSMDDGSVIKSEVKKFSALSDKWWDFNGPFKVLHEFNIPRLEYITKHIPEIKNAKILDVGCGGGLLCEPLARLGADVTGIDVTEKNILAAKIHAKASGLKINYKFESAKQHCEKNSASYDAVLCMEVLEHVENPTDFINTLLCMVKPGGLIFLATINRTIKSYAFAIIGAEYIARMLPIGTHNWQKFLKPSEIVLKLEDENFTTNDIKGVSYKPFSANKWQITSDVSINYMLVASKAKN